jgi:hypothetical protein
MFVCPQVLARASKGEKWVFFLRFNLTLFPAPILVPIQHIFVTRRQFFTPRRDLPVQTIWMRRIAKPKKPSSTSYRFEEHPVIHAVRTLVAYTMLRHVLFDPTAHIATDTKGFGSLENLI